MGIQNPPPEDVYDYGLFLLDKILGDLGHTLTDFPLMPQPQHNWAALTQSIDFGAGELQPRG